MHDTLESLLKRYAGITRPTDPSGGQRHSLVERMTRALHPELAAFFARILGDSGESDLPRLEALKCLEFACLGDEQQYLRLGETVLRLVRSSEDELIQNHAVMAAANFCDIDGMFKAITDLLLDTKQDSGLRWNAFAFLRQNGDSSSSREVLHKLLPETEFQRATIELLEEWDAAGKGTP